MNNNYQKKDHLRCITLRPIIGRCFPTRYSRIGCQWRVLGLQWVALHTVDVMDWP